MGLDGFVNCRCRQDGEACSHEDRELVSVRVGRWYGLVLALRQLGRQHFPVLDEVLPEANGGTAPASAASAALAELDLFERQTDLGEEPLLCDADTGAVVWRGHHYRGGANLVMGGMELGVDLDGFFVRRTGEDGELFRAMRFTQEVVSTTRPMVRFTDGARELTLAVSPVTSGSHQPVNLETRTRRRTPEDYRGVVNALRRLFVASAETGNPVVWC